MTQTIASKLLRLIANCEKERSNQAMLSIKVDGKQFTTWHAGETLPLIPKDAISVEVYADEQEVTRLLAWLVQMDERGYSLSVSAKLR